MSYDSEIIIMVIKVVLCTEGIHQLFIKDIICNRRKSEYYIIFEVLDEFCNDIVLKIFKKRHSTELISLMKVLEIDLKSELDYSIDKIIHNVVYANIYHAKMSFPNYANIDCFITNKEFEEYLNNIENSENNSKE